MEGKMTVETIKAGQWLFNAGCVAEYCIYKLITGKVSIYKSGKKIREVEMKEGMKPIILGITAVLRDDLTHQASVKTETDVQVKRIYVDQIKGILANEIPDSLKKYIETLTESIVMGNEILCMIYKFSETPRINLKIPSDAGSETQEILSELKRLYDLITTDVDAIIKEKV
ncbi:MAG: hypothetical protein CMH78_00815 [Nitrospinae bacterium]|jgi:hypothetical protein|nr:hypothetical protein [Nitrospinota bacterium]